MYRRKRGDEVWNFPTAVLEGRIFVARGSYRQNLSEDRDKFLRFLLSIVSHFPCRETELGYFPLEICGSLKWLLKFKVDIRQHEKEVTYTVSFSMTNSF